MKIKYRVGQVASDLNIDRVDIKNLLSKFGISVVNHMQVLSNDELDIIFDYLTQHSDEFELLPEDSPYRYNPKKYNLVLHPAIIKWSDSDYYVVALKTRQVINHDTLVDICANKGWYYQTREDALARANNLKIDLRCDPTYEILEYDIDDYPPNSTDKFDG